MSSVFASVTGHRPDKIGQEWDHAGPRSRAVVDAFRRAIREHGVTHLIVGGALGVDTLAARAAYLEGVPYSVAVPFRGQESRWNSEAQARYRVMLDNAVKVRTVSGGGYSPAKMQSRNEFMVDHSHLVLAWWDGSPGGTANCLRYAVSRGVTAIQLHPQGPHIPDSAGQF